MALAQTTVDTGNLAYPSKKPAFSEKILSCSSEHGSSYMQIYTYIYIYICTCDMLRDSPYRYSSVVGFSKPLKPKSYRQEMQSLETVTPKLSSPTLLKQLSSKLKQRNQRIMPGPRTFLSGQMLTTLQVPCL